MFFDFVLVLFAFRFSPRGDGPAELVAVGRWGFYFENEQKLANPPKVRYPPLAAPASFAPTKQTKRNGRAWRGSNP